MMAIPREPTYQAAALAEMVALLHGLEELAKAALAMPAELMQITTLVQVAAVVLILVALVVEAVVLEVSFLEYFLVHRLHTLWLLEAQAVVEQAEAPVVMGAAALLKL
jgi:hypothetical protein